MTIITMMTEMIATGLANTAAKRKIYCNNIRLQVDRMVNMTQDILDYAMGKSHWI